jgi:hypothetical protein
VTDYLDKNIELLEDVPGDGAEAAKGSTVVYNARLYLRRGDEVTMDAKSISMYADRLDTRTVDGVELINHTTTLGKRQPIAGVEKSLYGMRPGGYREVLIGAHLAYGEKGIEDLIPPNAMLRIRLWVRDVQPIG